MRRAQCTEFGNGVQVRPAVISYTFNAEPEIQSVTLPQIESGGSFTYKPENNDASGNKIPDGTIYEWTRPISWEYRGFKAVQTRHLKELANAYQLHLYT